MPAALPTRAGTPSRPPGCTGRRPEDGNALAQYNLGAMYDHGAGGLTANNFEAVRFYRMAAEQNYPAAQSSGAI